MSTVGVVVPAYCAERWIGACLGSLVGQTLQDWVCVVVDDGSTDATGRIATELAARDPRIRVHRQENVGLSRTRWVGLGLLPEDVELVLLLDSDDLLLPRALSTLTGALAARPDAVGAFGLAEYVDAAGVVQAVGEHPRRQRDRRSVVGRRLADVAPTADVTFAEVVVNSPVWPSAVALLRREAVRTAGPWRTDMEPQEDWEHLLRLVRLGPVVATDRHVALYRRHADNATGRIEDLVRAQSRVRRSTWEATSGPPRREVTRAWRYLRLREGAVFGREAWDHLAARRRSAAMRSVASGVLSAAQALLPAPPTERWAFATFTRSARSGGSVLRSPDAVGEELEAGPRPVRDARAPSEVGQLR